MSGLNDEMIIGLMRSVGPDTALDLIRFFLDETRERLHRMADLAGTDRLAELMRDAHSLKSAALTYGAETLGELSRALEMACRSGDPEAVAKAAAAVAAQGKAK